MVLKLDNDSLYHHPLPRDRAHPFGMIRWPGLAADPGAVGRHGSLQDARNVAYLRWFKSARIAWFNAGLMKGMPTLHLNTRCHTH